MSRKHFQALADELASTKPEKGVRLEQWKRDCQAVARACRAMNGRFDEGRFLAACGFND